MRFQTCRRYGRSDSGVSELIYLTNGEALYHTRPYTSFGGFKSVRPGEKRFRGVHVVFSGPLPKRLRPESPPTLVFVSLFVSRSANVLIGISLWRPRPQNIGSFDVTDRWQTRAPRRNARLGRRID